MIGATVAMASMAVLFIVFGVFKLADRGDCGGHCHGCTSSCDFFETGGRES